MAGQLIASLVISLLLTCIIELTAAFIMGPSDKKSMLLVLLVNTLTNPVVVLLNFLNREYFGLPTAAVVAVLEIAAVITEGFCYKTFDEKRRRPYLCSLIFNAVSYCTGIVINFLI